MQLPTLRPLLAGLLISTVVLSGCDSFVDKAQISKPTKEEFYQTQEDFQTAINGAYDALQQDGTFYRNYWILFEIRSDNTDQGQDVTGLSRALFEINRFIERSGSEIVQQAWIDSYDGIERCNVVLDQADNLPDGPFKNRVRGEALFVRSLLYYHLAVAFGNITLTTQPTGSPAEASEATSQVSAQEVYTQITGDLETAQGLLPPRSGFPGAQAHKASSGAANALLGKVYLTMGEPQQAATALQRVIDSGEYALVSDYGNLWGPENENNAESIFEIQYTTGAGGEGSGYTNFFSPSSDLQTGEGVGRNRPTPAMVEAYLDLDGDRFRASMDTSYVDAAGETQLARHVTKFESDPFANFEAENNWIVLRYADVLLMMAEAIGPSGTTADGRTGWDLIDEVRDRSLPDPQFDVDRAGDFFAELLRERRVELAFENHRWPDLKRFEQYIDGVALNQVQDELPDLASSDFNLLFPIPQREVDVAGLTQNPGYGGS
jgi:tetratricopeptide (TPR) repeat protein